LTMVGLDVGDKTLLSPKYLEQLGQTHGPMNDFIYQVAHYLIDLSAQYGSIGTPMYDPLAVGVAIDSTFVKHHSCMSTSKPAANSPAARQSPIDTVSLSATSFTATVIRSKESTRSSPTQRFVLRSTPIAFSSCLPRAFA